MPEAGGGTHESRERCGDRRREWELAPDEDAVRGALHVREDVGCEVLHGADHVVEPHEESAPLSIKGRSARIHGWVRDGDARRRRRSS